MIHSAISGILGVALLALLAYGYVNDPAAPARESTCQRVSP